MHFNPKYSMTKREKKEKCLVQGLSLPAWPKRLSEERFRNLELAHPPLVRKKDVKSHWSWKKSKHQTVDWAEPCREARLSASGSSTSSLLLVKGANPSSSVVAVQGIFSQRLFPCPRPASFFVFLCRLGSSLQSYTPSLGCQNLPLNLSCPLPSLACLPQPCSIALHLVHQHPTQSTCLRLTQ